MVTRLAGLKELETWIVRLEHENSDNVELEELDEMIENSFNELVKMLAAMLFIFLQNRSYISRLLYRVFPLKNIIR